LGGVLVGGGGGGCEESKRTLTIAR
jgi:hypothetical protein